MVHSLKLLIKSCTKKHFFKNIAVIAMRQLYAYNEVTMLLVPTYFYFYLFPIHIKVKKAKSECRPFLVSNYTRETHL